jgi:crossover junction endodeoxyribonuclease RusA
LISFFVEGTPRSQGSMRAFNNRVVHNKTPELMAWRKAIAVAAQVAGCQPIDSPIKIIMHFILKRPKSTKRKYPTVPLDLDKMVRAVGDSLTGVAYIDDAQIIEINATKSYGEPSGVHIEITDLFDRD